MCGIMAGAKMGGCAAIAVTGGYADDADTGRTLSYTGEGGKDLDGNKRNNSGIVADQKLDKVLRSCE